jgi:[lysine-biosynthesis-protein LysW]--L-2-aminoadipate ligase
VAIDVFETKAGYSINEVNYTMEFRNSIDVTGVNIPAKVVDYVLEVGKK